MSDELLDIRPRHRPPWWLAVAAAAAVGVLAGLALRGSNGGSPAAAPSTVTVTSTVAAPGPAAVDAAADTDSELALIATTAYGAAPAPVTTDEFTVCERPGDAKEVLPRLESALHTAFPHYRITDVARVRDAGDGLCRVQLRAHSGATVLVVRVVAPIEETHLLPRRQDVASRADTDITTEYARVSAGGGWIVTVGSHGPAAHAPSTYALVELARNRDLRW